MNDMVDRLMTAWSDQRPELDCSALGVIVRVQLLSKLFKEAAEQTLQDMGLKLWEYDVLSALRRQGAPFAMQASELAEASLLTSGTITARVDGLERRGLVERSPRPEDRRSVNVRLTAAGKRVIDAAVVARLSSAEERLQCLSTAERRKLTASLRKVMLDLA